MSGADLKGIKMFSIPFKWHNFSDILSNSLKGWFIYKSEIIPIAPDLGNASAGTREKRS